MLKISKHLLILQKFININQHRNVMSAALGWSCERAMELRNIETRALWAGKND